MQVSKFEDSGSCGRWEECSSCHNRLQRARGPSFYTVSVLNTVAGGTSLHGEERKTLRPPKNSTFSPLFRAHRQGMPLLSLAWVM